MSLDYEKEIELDEGNLDYEWIKQPALFLKYASAESKAKRELNLINERIKIRRSQLTNECIKTKEKATGAVIEAYYRTHKDHIKLKEELIEAQYESDMLSAAVFAFHQRKSALENLVKLHGQGYFSSPKTDDDEVRTRIGKEAKQENAKRIRKENV